MSTNQHTPSPLPPLYAITVPGLETIAAEEIAVELKGEIKKKMSGAVVFRLDEVSDKVLRLRTTEDVFFFAWGTDQLSFRAQDLESIRRWTSRDVDWDGLLRLHHAIRPKPKGKPTFRIVTQMQGHHGYRRIDAGMALARGLDGKLPASWKHAEENASVEVWLTIDGRRALCGLRLSDRTMRHRKYKLEHIPASLRPTVAAAMIRPAKPQPGEVFLDPMCGAGTILAELADSRRQSLSHQNANPLIMLGGDFDSKALRSARSNLARFGDLPLIRWDAAHLPIGDETVDGIISNPPFGIQLKRPEGIRTFYRRLVGELHRVLSPGGRAVLLVSEFPALKEAAGEVGWSLDRQLKIRVLGQSAILAAWKKTRMHIHD
jgi:23S rRNA G2445 N2-methylase RlmL